MRLADIVLRSGHLSEQVLIEAVMTGERPAHLDRCDICAERAVDLGRWLDEVRATGNDAVDAAFPPDRLVVQQQQILRRLEQLDQPARVIAFPNQYALSREAGGRRVAAGWVAVAAAAGILLGVVSTRVTQGFQAGAAGTAPTVQAAHEPAMVLTPASATMLDDTDLDRAGGTGSAAFSTLDRMTPSIILASNVSVHR